MPRAVPLSRDVHLARTDDGWRLELIRFASPRLDRGCAPVLIVPGYGMNGFIFEHEERNVSLVRYLAEAGRETWVVNLRGQGASRPVNGSAPGPSLAAYATLDLPAAIEGILSRTVTGASNLDVIGASLGGSITYAHLALTDAPRVRRLVAVGSPLSWREQNKLVRAAFGSPRLAGMVPVRGSRRLAGWALPVAKRLPFLLSIYLNPAHVDLQDAAVMVQTVEDPDRRGNAELARWMGVGELVVGGVEVAAALQARTEPLLLVVGNRDGVVPPASALAAAERWGGPVETRVVGTDRRWYAHADLFVARRAPEEVFAPIVDFLVRE